MVCSADEQKQQCFQKKKPHPNPTMKRAKRSIGRRSKSATHEDGDVEAQGQQQQQQQEEEEGREIQDEPHDGDDDTDDDVTAPGAYPVPGMLGSDDGSARNTSSNSQAEVGDRQQLQNDYMVEAELVVNSEDRTSGSNIDSALREQIESETRQKILNESAQAQEVIVEGQANKNSHEGNASFRPLSSSRITIAIVLSVVVVGTIALGITLGDSSRGTIIFNNNNSTGNATNSNTSTPLDNYYYSEAFPIFLGVSSKPITIQGTFEDENRFVQWYAGCLDDHGYWEWGVADDEKDDDDDDGGDETVRRRGDEVKRR